MGCSYPFVLLRWVLLPLGCSYPIGCSYPLHFVFVLVDVSLLMGGLIPDRQRRATRDHPRVSSRGIASQLSASSEGRIPPVLGWFHTLEDGSREYAPWPMDELD